MTAEPVNTDIIQSSDKPWQFQPGQSGNPSGKPRGARHKTTLAVQALLDGEAEAITRKAVELALAGDMAALRLCLERILPPRKDTPVTFALPPISKVEDVVEAIASVVQAVSDGMLMPSEGQAIATLLETQRKCIETSILERKLVALQTILLSRK